MAGSESSPRKAAGLRGLLSLLDKPSALSRHPSIALGARASGLRARERCFVPARTTEGADMMPVDRFSGRPMLLVAALLLAGLVLAVTARRVDRRAPWEEGPGQ